MKVKSESEVAQSCPILRDPMDCSLPGSSAHGIFHTRVLEWGAIAFSILTLLAGLKVLMQGLCIMKTSIKVLTILVPLFSYRKMGIIPSQDCMKIK